MRAAGCPNSEFAPISCCRIAVARCVSGLAPQKVVVIDPSLSVDSAFQLLLDRDITSAPVLTAAGVYLLLSI